MFYDLHSLQSQFSNLGKAFFFFYSIDIITSFFFCYTYSHLLEHSLTRQAQNSARTLCNQILRTPQLVVGLVEAEGSLALYRFLALLDSYTSFT